MAKKTGQQVVFEGTVKNVKSKGKNDSIEIETKSLADGPFIKLRHFYLGTAMVRITVTELEPVQKSLAFSEDPKGGGKTADGNVPGPEPL